MVEIDRHDGIDRFASSRMVFTDPDPAPATAVEHTIAVAPFPSLPSPARGRKGGARLWRQSLGVSLAGMLAVQTLIGKVGKDAGPARDQPRRAAIFMNTRADIEAGRRNVRGDTVGTGAHDHVAALLLWASFEPVNIVAVDANVRQYCGLSDDKIRGDRRFPGAVRRDLSCRHFKAPPLP